jgi:hypothetical protein
MKYERKQLLKPDFLARLETLCRKTLKTYDRIAYALKYKGENETHYSVKLRNEDQ